MIREISSTLPSIENQQLLEPLSAENAAQDGRTSNENNESSGNRFHEYTECPHMTDSPSIIKSRSLTKKIRERHNRDRDSCSFTATEIDTTIPSIHATSRPAAAQRDNSQQGSSYLDDGIAASGGNTENSMFSSSGRLLIASNRSTPNRTRADSIGNMDGPAPAATAVEPAGAVHGVMKSMPSLPLHLMQQSGGYTDNPVEMMPHAAKHRGGVEVPIVAGGSPPMHHYPAAHLPPTITSKQSGHSAQHHAHHVQSYSAGASPSTSAALSSSGPFGSHHHHSTGSSGAKTDRHVPKALEKIIHSDLLGSSSQPGSGRVNHQQHHSQPHHHHARAFSGSQLPSASKLSALSLSPAQTSTKTRVSSGSASTMMAVHGLHPATAVHAQERQCLMTLDTTQKSGVTPEEVVDRLVQERLLEAKALDRKNSSGAVMHQFSLWNKTAAPVQRSQSDTTTHASVHHTLSSTSTGTGVGAGVASEDGYLAPVSVPRSRLAALSHTSAAIVPDAPHSTPHSTPSLVNRKAGKLRGPRAVLDSVTATSEENAVVSIDNYQHALNTSTGEDSAHNLGGSKDTLDDDYTLEFEPFHEEPDKSITAVNGTPGRSLANTLRKKVGGAKLSTTTTQEASVDAGMGAVSCDGSVSETKQSDTSSKDFVFATPEKKSVSQASTARIYSSGGEQESVVSDQEEDGWYSDEFIEDEEELQKLSAMRPRSAEPGSLSEEAAVIVSMSQSGPAAFASLNVSSSAQILPITGSTEEKTNFISSSSAKSVGIEAARRASIMSGDNSHFVNRLGQVVATASSSTAGTSSKRRVTTRSASECSINFDSTAATSKTTTATLTSESSVRSTTKGSSSKYQTLRDLKSTGSFKSVKSPKAGTASTTNTTSGKSPKTGSVPKKRASKEATAIVEALAGQKSFAPVFPEQLSASVGVSSRNSTINTALPLSSLLAPTHEHSSSATAVAEEEGAISSRSRDNASPALSEVSDTEDAVDLKKQSHLVPLRVDVEDIRERTSSEHSLAAAQGEDHSPLRWRKGEVIGEGTFGKVYKGMNERTGELLAIKQLCLIDGTSGEVDTLCKEINVMWNLEHENIVRYMGTSKSERYLYIILEYVTGGSIAGMIAQFGAFNEKLIKRFTLHVVTGVDYLHSKGIVHRDIKGANILVSGNGVAKLADFGCSKQLAGMCTASIEESLRAIRGSVPWMAPEVIKQSGHGRSSDIWSIGATVIEMATGKPPWSEFSNSLATMFHVATCKTPPSMPPGASLSCCDFLARCLAIEPTERATAHSLLCESAFLHSTISSAGGAPTGESTAV